MAHEAKIQKVRRADRLLKSPLDLRAPQSKVWQQQLPTQTEEIYNFHLGPNSF